MAAVARRRWGNAEFVAYGDTPWTDEEALAFMQRVEEIQDEERERVRDE